MLAMSAGLVLTAAGDGADGNNYTVIADAGARQSQSASEVVAAAEAAIVQDGIHLNRATLYDRLQSRFLTDDKTQLVELDHATAVRFWRVMIRISPSYGDFASQHVIPWYTNASHWRGASQRDLADIYTLLRPMRQRGGARLEATFRQMAQYIRERVEADPQWITGQDDLVRVQLIRLAASWMNTQERAEALGELREAFLSDASRWESIDSRVALEVVFAAREMGMTDSDACGHIVRNLNHANRLDTIPSPQMRTLNRFLGKHANGQDDVVRAKDQVELELLRRINTGQISWKATAPREMTRYIGMAANQVSDGGKAELIQRMQAEWVDNREVLPYLSAIDVKTIDKTLTHLGDESVKDTPVVDLWLAAMQSRQWTIEELAVIGFQMRSHGMNHAAAQAIADYVIEQAARGELEEHPVYWRNRGVAWLIQTPQQRERLFETMKQAKAGPTPAVSLIMARAHREHGQYDDYMNRLDDQLEVGGHQGDVLARWYIARALASYVDANYSELNRLRGKRYLDQALAAAQSEAARLEVVDQIAKAYGYTGHAVEGQSFLSSIRPTFEGEKAEQELDRLEKYLAGVTQAQKLAEDREQRERDQDWRAGIEKKLAEATEKGNQQAARHYQRLLDSGSSRDGERNKPVMSGGGI